MLPSLFVLLSALCALLLSVAAASQYPLTLDDPRIPGTITELSGSQWTASSPSQGLSMPARVPGDVISDLFRAGVIPEPLYELNWIRNASLWNDHLWAYNRTHVVDARVVARLQDSSADDDLLLVFDGIKMGADIYSNGVWIGRSIAQFERHVFSFRQLLANKTTAGALRAGANTISVVFDPAINTELFMQCTGGWDWAPYSHSHAHTRPAQRTRYAARLRSPPASAALPLCCALSRQHDDEGRQAGHVQPRHLEARVLGVQ